MRNTPRSFARTSFLLAAALTLTPAIGATVTWDTSTAAGFQSGNGTWGTDSFWSSNGTTFSPWVSGDAAIFLGDTTAVNDAISLSSVQNLSGLTFGSATTFGNWTFSGSGMNLSANSIFTVNDGSTTAIGNVISGAFGLTKAGMGNLTLTGANTYTGSTTVSAGTLVYANAFAASAHTIASGAVLELNTASNRVSGTTTFSGVGTLRKTGAGTIEWGSGSVTFSLGAGALIDIQEGAFIGGSWGNEIWTTNLADLNVAAGAVFNGVEANVRVNRLTGAGTIKSGFGGAGYQALTFGVDNGSSNFDGVIADSVSPANIVKEGTGTIVFRGANTYTGTTTVSAGTLTLASGASLATSGFTTLAGATLVLNSSATVTTLSSSGNIQIGSGVTFTLDNTTNQSIGTGAASTSASTGTITGEGTFVKTGAGLVYVQGDMSASTTNVILSGGTLQFVGVSGADTNAFGTGTITVTANSVLNTFTDATRNKNSRLLNAISVTGATLILGGSSNGGSLILAGGVTATNAANITMGGGTVILESDLDMKESSGLFTMTSGTLRVGSGGDTGAVKGNLSSAGSLIFNRSNDSSYAGVLSGTGSLTQAGTGNLTLSGANTYTGSTTVSAGTLTLASGATMSAGALSVASGASLVLNASATTSTLTGSGAITIGSGTTFTLNTVSGNPQFLGTFSGAGSLVKSGAGEVFLTGDNSGLTGAITVNGGTITTQNSTSSLGSGDITVTANATIGAWRDGTFTNDGRLNNKVTVTSGTLTLGRVGRTILGEDVIASGTGSIVVGGGGTTVIEKDIRNVGTGTLSVASGTTLQLGNGGTTGTFNGGLSFNQATGNLAFNRSNDSSYAGVLSGTGSLTQAGTGNLTLSGANTYTGSTTVSAGTLTLASGATMSAGALSVASGASLVLNASATTSTLTGSGAITIGSGTTFTLNTVSGSPQFLGTLSGAGSLVKSGAGEVFLTGDNSGFTGAITVNGGMISVQNSISTLGSGDITVTANATVGTYTGPGFTIPGRLNNKLTVTAGTLTLGRNGRTILGNDVIASGTGSIVVGGGGTTVIEKNIANTGTGTLSVASGTTLQLGNGGTTGTFNGGLSFNQATGNLAFNRSDDVTYSGVLSGTGNLTQSGTGNLTLTRANTYTGTTTVSAGTLTIGAGGTLGTGNIVVSGGNLVGGTTAVQKFTGTSGSYSGILTGTTGLNKTGAGTLVLSGANTYTGTTTVAAGTLLVHGSVGAVTVNSGATIGGNGTLGATSLSSGSTIAAGASVGSLTVSSLTVTGGSNMAFQLNDAGGVAGVGYDLIAVTGALDLSGASTLNKVNLNLTTLANPADNVSGLPTVFDPFTSYSFTLLTYGSLNLGSNANVTDLFNITTTGFLSQFTSYPSSPANFSVVNDAGNNRLVLEYAAVPEPSTYGLGLGFLSLAVVAIRRQRRKASSQA